MVVPDSTGAAIGVQLALFERPSASRNNAADIEPAERNLWCQEFRGLHHRLAVWQAVVTRLDQNASLTEIEPFLLAEIQARYPNPATAAKVTTEIRRFLAFCRASGVEDLGQISGRDVTDYCWSASSRRGRWEDVTATTASNRQSFLRTMFAILTEWGVPANADVVGAPIKRPLGDTSRPLTNSELHQIHVHAYGGLLIGTRPLIVAFAEAGGDASEIAEVTLADVDLRSCTVQFTGPAARRNPLTVWAVDAITTVFAQQPPHPDEPLCVSAGLPTHRAAHSITVRLGEVIRDAGLSRHDGVTPKSIRLTTARRILTADGIEAAARFLGNESLDATARSLDHRWQH